MLFLGIDLGSSSIKLSVVDGVTGKSVGAIQYPEKELTINSPRAGWAEQNPDDWWDCVVKGCEILFARPAIDPSRIKAIGIAYQMHGLVLVDENQEVLRPAIIWCDSRANDVGQAAFKELGSDYCFEHLLNSPSNFTAAKLRWVQENEPEVFARVHKAMLPGDFIAMKLTGEITTSPSSLSEATLWDFSERRLASRVLDQWGIDAAVIPPLVPNIGLQGEVSAQAARVLGLSSGVQVSYRSGDQPNNAFSLNVLNPGEVAATAGTSGVIYGVTDKPVADIQSRVNTFLHVTDTQEHRRNGVLVCVNGTGRLYSWLRQLLSAGGEIDYQRLNELAADVAVGSEGLRLYPFGNGGERIFQNRNLRGHIQDIDFNRHNLGHIVRAAQEGIVFALNQGFEVLKELDGNCDVIRVAKGNMFLSDDFTRAFANTTQTAVELYETDGAEGAARAAGLGYGYFTSHKEAFRGLVRQGVVEPDAAMMEQYREAYEQWVEGLPVQASVVCGAG